MELRILVIDDERAIRRFLATVLSAHGYTVVEAASGRATRVATLLGAAQGMREAAGATVYGYYRPDDARKAAAAAQARAVLGDDAWDDAVDEGRALEVDDAVRYVLTGSARTLRLAT